MHINILRISWACAETPADAGDVQPGAIQMVFNDRDELHGEAKIITSQTQK